MRTRVDTLRKVVNAGKQGKQGKTSDLHLVERFEILELTETFAKERCVGSWAP